MENNAKKKKKQKKVNKRENKELKKKMTATVEMANFESGPPLFLFDGAPSAEGGQEWCEVVHSKKSAATN